MTHQEKGDELVEKFREPAAKPTAQTDNWGHFSGYGYDEYETEKAATQCAIICVEEIIEVVILAHDKLGCGEIGLLRDYIPYKFWNEVLNYLKSKQP